MLPQIFFISDPINSLDLSFHYLFSIILFFDTSRFAFKKKLTCIIYLFIYLFILPYALTDILGRLAQRLLVSDRKKGDYSTEDIFYYIFIYF